MIVADTGAVYALLDHDDDHHDVLVELYDAPGDWVLPWAILPEVDYLVAMRLGARVQDAFLAELAAGQWRVEYGVAEDVVRARALHDGHRDLHLGLVDSVVMAIAERTRANAIATVDLRHFGAVKLRGQPKLYPRDL